MAFTSVSAQKPTVYKINELLNRINNDSDTTYVVNFWATWCPPCVAEMPELVELQADMKDKNLQIVGIGIDSPSNIKEFLSTYKISYPVLIAGMSGTELSRLLGNQAGGLPFTVLIGADGQVKKTYLGRLDMKKVRADLLSL